MTTWTRPHPCAFAIILAAVSPGCGGAQPEPETATPPAEAAAVPDAPADEAPADESPGDERSGGSESDESAAAEGDEKEQREILYRMNSGKISIEVDGVRFVPTVEPIRKGGGWGLRVTVAATAKDDDMHRLLSPENGPLMMAGHIDRGKGNIETVGDERKGEDESFITTGEATELTRDFPAKGVAPLRAGSDLTLHVGLWGLGKDAGRRRPIRKLFVVRMVTGKHKPQPVISPPE